MKSNFSREMAKCRIQEIKFSLRNVETFDNYIAVIFVGWDKFSKTADFNKLYLDDGFSHQQKILWPQEINSTY
jgi:hypothetical protein